MKSHTVADGECLASIGHRHGFHWRTLWEHDANEPLRRLREDPFCLQEGDVVTIPERRRKQVSAVSGRRHRFRLRTTPVRLRLRFAIDDEPRANLAYRLVVDGKVTDGTTDANGCVDAFVPPDARRAILSIGEDHYRLLMRRLDPLSTTSGVQMRLQNLGDYDGPIDGELNEETLRAIAAFQRRLGLTESGQPDEATLAALDEEYTGEESQPE